MVTFNLLSALTLALALGTATAASVKMPLEKRMDGCTDTCERNCDITWPQQPAQNQSCYNKCIAAYCGRGKRQETEAEEQQQGEVHALPYSFEEGGLQERKNLSCKDNCDNQCDQNGLTGQASLNCFNQCSYVYCHN